MKKGKNSSFKIATSLLIALVALVYFGWGAGSEKESSEVEKLSTIDKAPNTPQTSGSGTASLNPLDAQGAVANTEATPEGEQEDQLVDMRRQAPSDVEIPEGLPEDLARALKGPPPEIPEDIKAQLKAPPPELPEDLKRQLSAPPPELPDDLKQQLNAPKPELPEDIKKALKSKPKVVSIEEVNNPS